MHITEHLVKNGVTSGYINMGGTIHMIGTKPDGNPWQTVITQHFDGVTPMGVVNLKDQATSSATMDDRGFVKGISIYRHLVDLETGEMHKSGLHSVTCISDSAWFADMLTTAIFLVGPSRSEKLLEDVFAEAGIRVNYAAVEGNGRVHISPGLDILPPDGV